MKRTSHETDGKFAITSFRKVGEFEKSANDRSDFVAICDAHGCDGWLYSAPSGFARWEYSRKAAYVVSLFNLAPAPVQLPVKVAINA